MEGIEAVTAGIIAETAGGITTVITTRCACGATTTASVTGNRIALGSRLDDGRPLITKAAFGPQGPKAVLR